MSQEAVAKGHSSDPAVAFVDADYATSLEDGRKSTTGYAVYIFGCLVSWKSRLQPIIATSIHQAELVALCTGIDSDVYVRLPNGISFVDPQLKAGSTGRIPKLLRALYGLRQSPSLWNKELNCFFVDTLKHARCASDRCLYYKVNTDSGKFILALANVEGYCGGSKRRELSQGIT